MELATIEFGLGTEGLTLKQDPDAGNLTAVNPAGQTVFATSTARMWDSSGTEPTAPSVRSRTSARTAAEAPTEPPTSTRSRS